MRIFEQVEILSLYEWYQYEWHQEPRHWISKPKYKTFNLLILWGSTSSLFMDVPFIISNASF